MPLPSTTTKTTTTTTTTGPAFITLRVDYYNTVLTGSPKSTTDTLMRRRSSRHKHSCTKLQVRTIVVCRVYFITSYTGSTSPSESSTRSLSWFVGVWRIKRRRIWATTALYPVIAVSSRHLGSASQHQLTVPSCLQKTFDCRAFSVVSPTVWNSLPTVFRDLSVGFGD